MPEKVPFDYTVILGGLGGGAVAVLNFFLMGLTVQKAAACEDEGSARMRPVSYTHLDVYKRQMGVLSAIDCGAAKGIIGVMLIQPVILIQNRYSRCFHRRNASESGTAIRF